MFFILKKNLHTKLHHPWNSISSRIVDPEKKAYLVRNKTPSVIWILNDQNSSKWPLESLVVGTICSHPGYRDSILQSGSNWHKVHLVLYSTILYPNTLEIPVPNSVPNSCPKYIVVWIGNFSRRVVLDMPRLHLDLSLFLGSETSDFLCWKDCWVGQRGRLFPNWKMEYFMQFWLISIHI